MQLPMVPAAERHRELIADFEADCPGLGKPQVMRIAGLPAADQARLRGDKLQMRLVTQPLRFSDGELALVDPVCDQAIERCRRQRRAAVALISILALSFGRTPSSSCRAAGRNSATGARLVSYHQGAIPRAARYANSRATGCKGTSL